MRTFTLAYLSDKVAKGEIDIATLQRMLKSERRSLSTVTLPTLGTFGCEFSQGESEAERKLREYAEDAKHNIPIIEEMLRKLGADINAPQTKPILDCEYRNYGPRENVNDGDGFGE